MYFHLDILIFFFLISALTEGLISQLFMINSCLTSMSNFICFRSQTSFILIKLLHRSALRPQAELTINLWSQSKLERFFHLCAAA